MGAIVTFTGVVRDVGDGLQHMLIEHYPGHDPSGDREDRGGSSPTMESLATA